MSTNLKLIEKENENDTELTKEQYIVNYLKSVIAIEEAMEPYKEQKKDLRSEYIEQEWLTREEIWSVIKAFRLYKKGADMDDINDMFDVIEKQFGGIGEV